MNDSLQTHGLYNPWNSPGQNTGVGAILFSRGSSQPRDQTQVSCIAGRFFTSHQEAHLFHKCVYVCVWCVCVYVCVFHRYIDSTEII